MLSLGLMEPTFLAIIQHIMVEQSSHRTTQCLDSLEPTTLAATQHMLEVQSTYLTML